MKLIRWQKPLSRRTFRSWKIPSHITKMYDIPDGISLDAVVQFGQESHGGPFRVNSGGEIQVGSTIAERIKIFARSHPAQSVRFSANAPSTTLIDIKTAEGELKDLPETEREAIRAARLGQGYFRAKLIQKYKGKCAVTGTAIPELLRASHIKPWRNSNNIERLSVDNGLLLIANLDAAFDARLISFSDTGKMLFHKRLGMNPQVALGIKKGSGLLKPLSPMQKKYLDQHRKAAGLQQ